MELLMKLQKGLSQAYIMQKNALSAAAMSHNTEVSQKTEVHGIKQVHVNTMSQ